MRRGERVAWVVTAYYPEEKKLHLRLRGRLASGGDGLEALEINKEKDSRFANGIGLVRLRSDRLVPAYNCPGKGPTLLECLMEAGAMTRTAAALRYGRYEAGIVAKSLWRTGMLEMFSVFSRDRYGVGARFELWLPRGSPLPADAREACRLAALALFYGHASADMPGFGWQLTRSSRRPVIAEVAFRSANEPVQ
jgi:hypothetical protein